MQQHSPSWHCEEVNYCRCKCLQIRSSTQGIRSPHTVHVHVPHNWADWTGGTHTEPTLAVKHLYTQPYLVALPPAKLCCTQCQAISASVYHHSQASCPYSSAWLQLGGLSYFQDFYRAPCQSCNYHPGLDKEVEDLLSTAGHTDPAQIPECPDVCATWSAYRPRPSLGLQASCAMSFTQNASCIGSAVSGLCE